MLASRVASRQWAPILTGQDSFVGFYRQVHQRTNIEPLSDPENPERNPEEHDV